MWPNHDPYLAPRLEQGKGIPKSCGEAQITGNHLTSLYDPGRVRPQNSPAHQAGHSSSGTWWVQDNRPQTAIQLSLSDRMMQKRLNGGTQQTQRSQNQDFAQQWSEKRIKNAKTRNHCDDVQHSSFNHQRAVYPQCIVWALQSPLELGLNFKKEMKNVLT